MPLKNPDPFASRVKDLNASVNPFVALLRDGSESGSLPIAFGAELAAFPGNWRDKIAAYHGVPTPKRLIVEIGCHKGQTLTALAADHPDTAFIGIDITFKRVVTTTQRAKARGLTNVYGVLANAGAIDKLFTPSEVDGCLIFFPDPWVKKKRQEKNRLVNAGFASKLLGALAPGGFCWFKTDQEGYFQAAEKDFLDSGFVATSEPLGLAKSDYSSAFEQRFQLQNLPTHAGKWLRTASPSPMPH